MPLENGLPSMDEADDSALDRADLVDQISIPYPAGSEFELPPAHDPGRARFEAFFRKMYGASEIAARRSLVPVRWLGGRTIYATRINGVDKALAAVAVELALLPATMKAKFLQELPGTFNWRLIAGTRRLSTHSFGIAIDIALAQSNYWRYDLPHPIYKNRIPLEIVEIFERHGFVWGGKWAHYDTMHLEYRPELLVPECR
jgi:hypothetical protein